MRLKQHASTQIDHADLLDSRSREVLRAYNENYDGDAILAELKPATFRP
jgi:hypothetical protein